LVKLSCNPRDICVCSYQFRSLLGSAWLQTIQITGAQIRFTMQHEDEEAFSLEVRTGLRLCLGRPHQRWQRGGAVHGVAGPGLACCGGCSCTRRRESDRDSTARCRDTGQELYVARRTARLCVGACAVDRRFAVLRVQHVEFRWAPALAISSVCLLAPAQCTGAAGPADRPHHRA